MTVEVGDDSKLALNTVTNNKNGVVAVAGVAELTVAAGATNADVDKAWTLTLGKKTCNVTLTTAENTPELVAQKIKQAVEANLQADVEVQISGAKLTFTEKSGKEGTVVPSSNKNVTFTKS